MRRAQPRLVAILLGALAACWVLLTPPGGAADEPSHLFRAGEVAEGHWDELLTTSLDPSPNAHWLPAEYAIPEPACFAQHREVPVDCAVGTQAKPNEDGDVFVATTADNYPVWGHVVPAIGTWLPGDGGIWAARVATAAVCVALLAAALLLVRPAGELGTAAVLVALTPMAWSTFGTVSPSAFATAGAVAVWVALVTRQPGWVLAAGWAALSLPRRDGLIWACLIVAAIVIASGREVLTAIWDARRRLTGPLTVVALATLAALVWGVTNASRMPRLGAAAPLLVPAAWFVRAGWDRLAGRPQARVVYATAVTAAGLLGMSATAVARPGGWDGGLTKTVVGETRRHLTEAIGVLGWLDAPLPRWATVGWVVLVGTLVVLAVRARAWATVGLSAGAFALAIVTSWVFELQEGSDYGRYWQGRYSLPLLAGVPIALVGVRASRRVAAMTGAAALLLVNVAAWAAVRRWAVGIRGTQRPWRWGADLFAVHPLPVLVAHAAASAALAYVLFNRPAPPAPEPVPPTTGAWPQP